MVVRRTLHRSDGQWVWKDAKIPELPKGDTPRSADRYFPPAPAKPSGRAPAGRWGLWLHRDWDLVFRRTDGGPIVNSTLNSKLHEVQRKHGLPELSLHELRQRLG